MLMIYIITYSINLINQSTYSIYFNLNYNLFNQLKRNSCFCLFFRNAVLSNSEYSQKISMMEACMF